jgi:collagenase-like PrtC family protease
MKTIELLSPAKDAETAIAAIKCGADAVYIGAPSFGARFEAANTIEQIRTAVEYAHPFYVKVYVTLNTLLFDNELSEAEKIISELYKIGIDGLIIQDVGLLELDLPPIPLIASTQMNNSTIEKIKFLEDIGFTRAILARELTLNQIRQIRKGTSIELECFIHGSLCVGVSGQCYLSYCIGGRSANRGRCAQPCRRIYSLKDSRGKTILENRYLLSLKDLNLSDYVEKLIDAGITAFKIEGRLKDIPYVANTTAFYRENIDAVLQKKNLCRSSSGISRLNFKPDLNKTFNRGFTDYGISGQRDTLSSINSPKSIGEFIGKVTEVEKSSFSIDSDAALHNADGMCFYDKNNNLTGTVINKVEGRKIWPQKMNDLRRGLQIYRNYDHQFSQVLEKNPAERKIPVSIDLSETDKGFNLTGTDEDGNKAVFEMEEPKQPAIKKGKAEETIKEQLAKLGNTIFDCSDIKLELKGDYFFKVSSLNAARRGLIEKLIEQREINRPQKSVSIINNSTPYPQKHLTYLGNCLNKKTIDFYHRHGVESIEPAAETGLDMNGKLVMTTKYCLRYELGLCKTAGQGVQTTPLILIDEDGRQFQVEFRCGNCGMDIFAIKD